jgi:hypothetical protein
MADPRSTIILPPPSGRNYSTPSNPPRVGGVQDVSAYATDLTRWENTHKHKFLFVVEVVFDNKYSAIVDRTRFALLAQTASRPKVKFEHQEYNSYGVRKGVLTKTTFEPITLSFIDDNDNSVMQFFTNTTRLMSPVTNIDNSNAAEYNQYAFNKTGTGTLTDINVTSSGIQIQENNQGTHRPNKYAQSAGYPGGSNTRSGPNSPTSIFRSVKIHHVHLFGEGVNTFDFKNPRLLSMDFDDLDMAASNDIALLKVQFGYDYLTSNTSKMTAEISKLVGSANYYLRRDLSGQ